MSIASKTPEDLSVSRGGPSFSRYKIAGVLLVLALLGAAAAVLLSGGTVSSGRGSSAQAVRVEAARKSGASGSPAGADAGLSQSGSKLTPGSSSDVSTTARHGTAQAGDGGAKTSGVRIVQDGKTTVNEVRDPEESKSFPVPASVHHRSAASPKVAAQVVVAAGAASDEEIRKELGEEEHAKAQEQAARHRALTPVSGGFSVGGNGTIPIPTNIPEAVQRVIAGGNAIADFPYIWGGGHGSFIANGYDCSGSVSYALAAGGLLSQPLVSGDLAKWGEPGVGRWITIYANAGHTFMNVDGVWFDTAGRSGPYASRWLVSQPPLEGYAVRHPPGF